jgi:hypothetical protein
MTKTIKNISYMRQHVLIAAILLFAAVGCKPVPLAQEVRTIIKGHFESRGYTVTEININEIAPVEISEKTYMGTPGFKVRISKITLTDKRREMKFEFNDAVITIRESTSSKTRWSIIDIKGIGLI